MIPDLVQLSWELAQDPWFLKTQKKKKNNSRRSTCTDVYLVTGERFNF